MFSPAYEIAKESAAVRALLGEPPNMRFSDFGDSKQDGAKPYAVQQVIAGNPENYLANVPDIDSVVVQIDVYALDMKQCRDAARALRAAFEIDAYIVSFGGQTRETDTKLWRVNFTVEFRPDR